MGWAARKNTANGMPRILATRLSTLRAAVDVQHLYRTGRHAGDRGSIYTLSNGAHIAETDATTIYAAALCSWLRARGASILTNDPTQGHFIGPYSSRNADARAWAADCYLACHLNAGGGKYAALEYMAGSASDRLAESIGFQIIHEFPIVGSARSIPLVHGQRGAVCIEGFAPYAAGLILEPFFGDNPATQWILDPVKLHQLGETIGEGVAQWWERRAVVRVA